MFSSFLKPGIWLGIFLLCYNNLINFLPSPLHGRLYLWMNLGVLGLIWLGSQKYLKLRPLDIGFTKQHLKKSLLFGLALTGIIILPFLFLLWLLPILGLHLAPPRLGQISFETFWWRILFRIPLGTAFFEETLFRGIFYGYLMRKTPNTKTLWVTSLFFACWHITPAFKVLSFNFQIGSIFLGFGLWFIGLLGAFVAGLLFAWLRHQTGNIGGCILAHSLINILALVIVSWLW